MEWTHTNTPKVMWITMGFYVETLEDNVEAHVDVRLSRIS